MGSTILSRLLLFFTLSHILRHRPPISAAANLHRPPSIFRPQPISDPTPFSAADTPTTFFEVTKPIPLPNTKPCSYLLLQHEFAFTYGKPPVLADYRPPSDCPSRSFAKIVLEWTAACKGTQFDRIFGVWLGGVELLRSCTAEPRRTGIVWNVKKDITRYHSLLMTNQTLAVYLGNLVDPTYTGVYHVNLSLHFYPAKFDHSDTDHSRADLILPVSRNLPLNDGLWFEITNSNVELKEFMIPRNTYRAVVELYVSFHENDEFWYTNLPNDYISSNNLTGIAPGNGPFREVVVSVDGLIVGAVSPFTVIYTGGFNPLLWRPISGIGSFDLPCYDFEISPILGKLLDGDMHKLEFTVTNALNVWYVDANLHLWLDKNSQKTHGKLLEHCTPPLSLSSVSDFTGLDGSFVTNASRSIVSIGWVQSSRGIVTTKSVQEYEYSSAMAVGKNGNLQRVNQVIKLNSSVVDSNVLPPFSRCSELERRFGLDLVSDVVARGKGAFDSVTNLTLSIDEREQTKMRKSRVKNVQNGRGYIRFNGGGGAVSGSGSNEQVYCYDVDDESLCYFRNVSGSNYMILRDEESRSCRCHGSALLSSLSAAWMAWSSLLQRCFASILCF